MAYLRRALTSAALIVIAACGQSGSSGTGGSTTTNCNPGATGACTCTGADIGIQTCSADGSMFLPCVCGDGGTSGTGGAGGSGGAGGAGTTSTGAGGSDAGTGDAGDAGSGNDASVADASDGGAVPQVLVSGQAGLKDLAIDGTSIYWTAAIGGIVGSCGLSGCAAPAVLAAGEPYPLGVAASGGQVFWTNNGLPNDAGIDTGSLGAGTSTAGSGRVFLIKQPLAGAIAADPNNIYWATETQLSACDPQNCVPAVVALDTAQAVAVDAAAVFWTSAVTGAVSTNQIGADAAAGQLITPAGYTAVNVRGLVVSGGNVYWGTPEQILSCPTSGCPGTPAPFATNQGIVGLQHPLATDGAYLYWSSGTTVVRCAIPGGCNGTPEVVAGGQIAPTAVAVNATTVYWIDGASILSLPKPK